MRLEQTTGSAPLAGPWIKRGGVLLVIVAAIAVPLWLYHSRGRKVPLEVLLEAEHYVVPSGETITLRSRVLPIDRDVTRRWSGPGTTKAGQRGELTWTAPSKPGLYTVALAAQRAGSRADDAITVRVIAAPLMGYPLDRLPAPPTAPTLPVCPPPSMPQPLGVMTTLHGKPCAGARVVLEVTRRPDSAGERPPWSFVSSIWQIDGAVQRGRFAELRLPTSGQVAAKLVLQAPNTGCLHQLVRTIDVDTSCSGGPFDRQGRPTGLVADFAGRLVSPGSFQLAAKPPRPPTAAVYTWQLEQAVTKKTNEPRLVHRFSKRQASYLVRLTIEAGPKRASAVRLLRDRTFAASKKSRKDQPGR
jgi:hypothetical protein